MINASGLPEKPNTFGGLPMAPSPVEAKVIDAPTYSSYKLPDVPKYTNYDLPEQQKLNKVEKPSFNTYFNENIKPALNTLLEENLKKNPQLVQGFANQYQKDMAPLIEKLGSSIYGRNVGATSGLGAEAFAKGSAEIMRPITDYANQLNANAVTQSQGALNSLLSQGLSQEANQNLNEYNTYQDRLYEQGKISYEQLLKNKQDYANFQNQFAGKQYEDTLSQNKDIANLENQSKNLTFNQQIQNAQNTASKVNSYQDLLFQSQVDTDLAKKKTQLDLALSGKLGEQGGSILKDALGLNDQQVSAMKTSGRENTLRSYYLQQLQNNQPIDERVMNSLAIVTDGLPLTEAEKAKYLSQDTNLPPSNAVSQILSESAPSSIKGALNEKYGFSFNKKQVPIKGSLFGATETVWDFNTPENVQKFNNLWANNPEFRDFVKANIV